MIGQEEFKLVQYTDNLILCETHPSIVILIDSVTIRSGLKVNHTKTEAIGHCGNVRGLGRVFF